MKEIKPCPCCGGKAKLSLFLGNYAVTCTNCLVGILPCKGLEASEAIEMWNKRI